MRRLMKISAWLIFLWGGWGLAMPAAGQDPDHKDDVFSSVLLIDDGETTSTALMDETWWALVPLTTGTYTWAAEQTFEVRPVLVQGAEFGQAGERMVYDPVRGAFVLSGDVLTTGGVEATLFTGSGAGLTDVASSSTRTVQDADGDTGLWTDVVADEDIVRFLAGNLQVANFATTGTWLGAVDVEVATNLDLAGNLTTTDNAWVGLGAAAGRMEFDDQATDEINFLGANVGIGTGSPITKTHIENAGETILRLRDTSGESTDYFQVSHNEGASSIASFVASASTGQQVFMDFNSVIADGSSAAQMRFNRTTNTSGAVGLYLHRGNNTATIDHYFVSGSSGGLVGLAANGGNVSIGGDATPDATLEVVGTMMGSASASGDGDRWSFDASGNGTFANNITATAGDITATAGDVVAGGWARDSGMKVLAADATWTSDALEDALTGMTIPATSGEVYAFEFHAYVTAGASAGFKLGIDGIVFTWVEASIKTENDSGISEYIRVVGDGATSAEADAFTGWVTMKGSFAAGATGTVNVVAAQNTSHANATTIYRGATLKTREQ